MKNHFLFVLLGLCSLAIACQTAPSKAPVAQADSVYRPLIITEPTKHDTDDPAIWIHPEDPSKSLIIGTDKDEDGALYVYNLEGAIVKIVDSLARPNNVDVEYGLQIDGQLVDIAVTTERLRHQLRVFSMPDMEPIDGGGIPVFEGEEGPEFRDPMGIALYKQPITGEIFAIVGRKNGPQDSTYIWQYRLSATDGVVSGTLVRKFGAFSGKKEIEAIVVDDELGYVYYSDEIFGVRKYYADLDKGNQELALFATTGVERDHEGLSIYAESEGKGYIILSDQQANRFHFFSREGSDSNPHDHQSVQVLTFATDASDGHEVTPVAVNENFPKGLLVAMSTDKTFQIYSWEAIQPKK